MENAVKEIIAKLETEIKSFGFVSYFKIFENQTDVVVQAVKDEIVEKFERVSWCTKTGNQYFYYFIDQRKLFDAVICDDYITNDLYQFASVLIRDFEENARNKNLFLFKDAFINDACYFLSSHHLPRKFKYSVSDILESIFCEYLKDQGYSLSKNKQYYKKQVKKEGKS